MKREFKDLCRDEQKEYLLLRYISSSENFLYGIFFLLLSALASFNSKGNFLYNYALYSGFAFAVIVLALTIYDKKKINNLFGI